MIGSSTVRPSPHYSTDMSGGSPSSRPSSADDWYWQAIEKYKDNEVAYAYLSQNPFLRANNPYSPNIFQQLVGLFGDNSAEVDYYNQLEQQARGYLSDWEKGQYEQEYNSPVQQVARDSVAGINPDLANNISPGSAAENDQPSQSVAMPGAGQGGLDIVHFGSTILSTAMNFVTGIQQMKSFDLDNLMKSLSLNDNYRKTALTLIKDGISEFMSGDQVGSDPDQLSMPELVDSVAKYLEDRIYTLPYSSREKKALRSMTSALIRSKGETGVKEFTNEFQKLVADSFGSLSESRNNASQSFGKPGANVDTVKAMRFVGEEIYKPLQDLQLKVNKAILKGDYAYHYKFNSLGGPGMQAEADFTSLELQKGMKKMKDDVLKAFEKINEKIFGTKWLPDAWKVGLQAGVMSAESAFMTQLGQGLPSINMRGMVQNENKNFYNNTYVQ